MSRDLYEVVSNQNISIHSIGITCFEEGHFMPSELSDPIQLLRLLRIGSSADGTITGAKWQSMETTRRFQMYEVSKAPSNQPLFDIKCSRC